MLTSQDLQRLCVKNSCSKSGTWLKLESDYSFKIRKDTTVEFAGFAFFKTFEHRKVHPLAQAAKQYGITRARHWGDFSRGGQNWIKENYDPHEYYVLFKFNNEIHQVSAYHVAIHI